MVLNGAPWVNGGPGGTLASVTAPDDQPAIASSPAAAAKLLVLDTGRLGNQFYERYQSDWVTLVDHAITVCLYSRR